MGFLSPVFLFAGVAAAVPLILHLFQRHEPQRVVFPAIQYLLRTNREHARTIRIRQLLLLLVRTLAVLLLVLVGARPFLPGSGGVHKPTALVIILDNSMSSGRVIDGVRVLERLQAAALQTLSRVGDQDRVWLLRSGEPWAPAWQGTADILAARVQDTEVSAAAGNVAQALVRARTLVEQSGLSAREIHLIGDLQADPGERFPDIGDVALVVFAADRISGPNLYLDSLSIGGGLAPLTNERSQLALRVDGVDASTSTPLRLVIGGRIQGGVSTVGATTAVLSFGPFASGWVEGFVETDPDALSADNRRYFAISVRSAPAVSTAGAESFFLESALPVLEAAGRIRRMRTGEVGAPDVRIAMGGDGLDRSSVPTVVFPEGDVATLPALNHRLATAGVAWRYETTVPRGEAGVITTAGLPLELRDTRVRTHYRLRPSIAADTGRILARLTSGEPWIVEATSAAGRVLLLASPLDEDASSLPVTADMIPLLDWALGSWSARSGASTEVQAGSPIPLPARVTSVVDPTGTQHDVRALTTFRETRWAGVYELRSDERIVSLIAVNPPPGESSLASFSENSFRAIGSGNVAFVRNRDRWERRVFVDSQGPEIGRELLVAALLLLLMESLVAASGTAAGDRGPAKSPVDMAVLEA